METNPYQLGSQVGIPTINEVVGRNVEKLRRLNPTSPHREPRPLTIRELAHRMRRRGFDNWSHKTVNDIQKNKRRLTVDELFGLADCFQVSIPELTYPHGLTIENERDVTLEKGVVRFGGTPIPVFKLVHVFFFRPRQQWRRLHPSDTQEVTEEQWQNLIRGEPNAETTQD